MNKEQYIEELKGLIDRTAIPGYVHGMNIALKLAEDLEDEPTPPVIDWKPINITQMKPSEEYLFWVDNIKTPIVGYINHQGSTCFVYSGEVVSGVTMYAEFNKPEGR